MSNTITVTRLQLNKPDAIFLVPAAILVLVLVISAIIAFAIQRTGIDLTTQEYIEGARNNMGAMWSLPGFLTYFGVQSISTTFPFGLALGATRKAFALGTLVSHAIQAVYVAAMMVVLLLLEKATGHWFANIYVLDVIWLGDGSPLWMFVNVFLGTLTVLSIGGCFGAIWVRFGNKGPTILGVALGLVLAITVLLLVPYFGSIFANFQLWWLAVTAGVLILLSVAGEYFFLRRASVR